MAHALAPSASLAQTLTQVRADYPALSFTLGSDDHWDAHSTVFYTAATEPHTLLHELAHAVLGHQSYQYDIDLLRMERAAWSHARTILAPHYAVTITDDHTQSALDSYRDWLHNRSLCPDCHLSGMQQPDQSYQCLGCRLIWRASPAKTCALRRYRQADSNRPQ